MKFLITILFSLLLFSCSVSTRLINKGNYDLATDTLAAALSKSPVNKNKVEALAFAFSKANNINNEKILALKKSGNPDIWEAVYNEYNVLDRRQEKVGKLPDTVLSAIHYVRLDYSKFLFESREKACVYLYAKATKSLKSGVKTDLLAARTDLQKINLIYPGFRDVTELLTAIEKRMPVTILYTITNKYEGNLPGELGEILTEADLSGRDTPGYEFVASQSDGRKAKYIAEITIRDIRIAPENTGKIQYAETARIQDGIAYQLDDSGNFARDSAGNRIEMPKYKSIACYVTEKVQKKSMLITGIIEITDLFTGKIIARKALTGESKFSHRSASFKGDLTALSPETFSLVGSKELDYPDDVSMIFHANELFLDQATGYINEVLTGREGSK